MPFNLPLCSKHRRQIQRQIQLPVTSLMLKHKVSLTGCDCWSYSNKYTVLDENGTTVALLAEDVGGIGDEPTLLFSLPASQTYKTALNSCVTLNPSGVFSPFLCLNINSLLVNCRRLATSGLQLQTSTPELLHENNLTCRSHLFVCSPFVDRHVHYQTFVMLGICNVYVVHVRVCVCALALIRIFAGDNAPNLK